MLIFRVEILLRFELSVEVVRLLLPNRQKRFSVAEQRARFRLHVGQITSAMVMPQGIQCVPAGRNDLMELFRSESRQAQRVIRSHPHSDASAGAPILEKTSSLELFGAHHRTPNFCPQGRTWLYTFARHRFPITQHESLIAVGRQESEDLGAIAIVRPPEHMRLQQALELPRTWTW